MKRSQAGFTVAGFRARIKVESLRKRLEKHALGKLTRYDEATKTNVPCSMTATEIKAAFFLIEQAVGRAPQPIVGDPNNPLVVQVVSYLDSPPADTNPE